MQNVIVMNKNQIKEFFAPAQVNLPEIHHLYVAVDHENKTARFSVQFDYPGYHIPNVIYSASESYGYREFAIDTEIEMHNLVYPEEMEAEKEDSYEFVLEFMKKHDLLYEKIQRWESGESYIGDDLSDYYVIVSKNRDSGILEESNWDYVIKTFDEKDILIAHFNHWAVGWVEQILIKEDNYLALEKADEMLDIDVPYLDEEDYYQRISERAGEIEEDMKKDLRNKFIGNGLTYSEKSEYAKRMWGLDLKGNYKETIHELSERMAGEE
jgi:hypothetical protein